MKKLYTLLTAATVAVAAVAAPVQFGGAQGKMTPANRPTANIELNKHKAANLATNAVAVNNSRRVKANAAPAPSADEWTYLGEATYTDGLLYMAYAQPGETLMGGTYKVPCYQSTTNENRYLLQDVYPEEAFIYSIYWILDENAASSLILDKSQGDDKVLAQYTFNCTDGDVVTTGQYKYGTYANNVVHFDAQAFIVSYSGTPYAYSAAFNILLPGAADYSVSATNAGDFCGDNNTVKLSVEVGADATNVKWYDFEGIYSSDADVDAAIAQVGNAWSFGTASANYTLKTAGWHTLAFVSADPEGNVAWSSQAYFYAQPTMNTDEWYDLGMGTYTDDSFIFYYGVKSAIPAYQVHLYESKAQPGLFRVEDIMKNNPYYSQFSRQHAGHTHYLDIDATDEGGAVSIDPQPLGAGMTDTDWAIASNKTGTFVDGAITFPFRGLICYDQELGGYYANTFNNTGNFKLEVPYLVEVSAKDANGTAITDAWVFIGEDAYEADADGKIIFALPSNTDSQIMVYRDGYEPYETTIAAGGEHHQIIEATLAALECNLTVNVRDEEMEPIEGAWIFIGDIEAETNAAGNYSTTLSGVFGQALPISVYKDGYEYWEGSADFTETMDAYVTVVLEASTCYAYFTIYNADEEPVEGATIEIEDHEPIYTTDATGRATAELKGSFGRAHAVKITHKDYNTHECSIEFTEMLEAYHNITLLAKDDTGIENVSVSNVSDAVYNIQGMRVSDNARGLLIINGVKMLRK